MGIIVLISGIIIGYILNIIISIINFNIKQNRNTKIWYKPKYLINFKIQWHLLSAYLKEAAILKLNIFNILVIFISGLVFLISYLKFEFNIIFLRSAVLDCILIIVAFVDIKNKIIPNKIVIISLAFGVIFFFTGDISLVSMILGMLTGGGILFILALIPGAIGGGDIKFMFAMGVFLGYEKTLKALFIAFLIAAVISIILLLSRIKGRKDFIPLGPFLALGSFLAFNFLR